MFLCKEDAEEMSKILNIDGWRGYIVESIQTSRKEVILQITETRISLVSRSNSRLRAYASVTFDDVLL